MEQISPQQLFGWRAKLRTETAAARAIAPPLFAPAVLEDPYYLELRTPARQRDFLQGIFADLKAAAASEALDLLGEERVTAATVRGEEARRRARSHARPACKHRHHPVLRGRPGFRPGPAVDRPV